MAQRMTRTRSPICLPRVLGASTQDGQKQRWSGWSPSPQDLKGADVKGPMSSKRSNGRPHRRQAYREAWDRVSTSRHSCAQSQVRNAETSLILQQLHLETSSQLVVCLELDEGISHRRVPLVQLAYDPSPAPPTS